MKNTIVSKLLTRLAAQDQLILAVQAKLSKGDYDHDRLILRCKDSAAASDQLREEIATAPGVSDEDAGQAAATIAPAESPQTDVPQDVKVPGATI